MQTLVFIHMLFTKLENWSSSHIDVGENWNSCKDIYTHTHTHTWKVFIKQNWKNYSNRVQNWKNCNQGYKLWFTIAIFYVILMSLWNVPQL